MNLCLSHVINQLSGRDLSGSCISGARFFLPLFLSFLFSMRYYCHYYNYLSGVCESFINDMD